MRRGFVFYFPFAYKFENNDVLINDFDRIGNRYKDNILLNFMLELLHNLEKMMIA